MASKGIIPSWFERALMEYYANLIDYMQLETVICENLTHMYKVCVSTYESSMSIAISHHYTNKCNNDYFNNFIKPLLSETVTHADKYDTSVDRYSYTFNKHLIVFYILFHNRIIIDQQ